VFITTMMVVLLVFTFMSSNRRGSTFCMAQTRNTSQDDYLSNCYADRCLFVSGILCWQRSGCCPSSGSGCWDNPSFTSSNYKCVNSDACTIACNTNYQVCSSCGYGTICRYNANLFPAFIRPGGNCASAKMGDGTYYCYSPPTPAPSPAPSARPTPIPTPEPTAAAGNKASLTFTYTGSAQQWTVPAGLATFKVDAYGAAGGDSPTVTSKKGGLGGYISVSNITASLFVGQTLLIYVGAAGSLLPQVGLTTIGLGGGGSRISGYAAAQSDTSGGGATDLRTSIGNTSR